MTADTPLTPSLPTLEIIVHIWAGQLSQYAHLAHYQLSSLFLNPPTNTHVTYTACYCSEDPLAVELLHRFYWRAQSTPRVAIHLHSMPRDRLMRRAIGRNECARQSAADVVYFAGCDYAWGAGALDAIAVASLANPDRLIHPAHILCHKSHEIGDRAVAKAAACSFEQLVQLDERDFEPTRVPRAIGCLQIVPGEVARARGYLPESKRFQHPAGLWRRTFEDISARRSFGLSPLAVEIPNIYRFRHSRQGRFVDEHGVEIPKRRRRLRVRRASSEETGE